VPGGERRGALGDVEGQPDRDLRRCKLVERLRLGQRDRAIDEAIEPLRLEEVVQRRGSAVARCSSSCAARANSGLPYKNGKTVR